MKAGCKLDPLTAISGIVVAFTADQDEGAAYVALSGVDRAKLSTCVQLVAQGALDHAAAASKDGGKDAGKDGGKDAGKAPPTRATVAQDGNVTAVTAGPSTAYFGWVGKDVVVVATRTADRAALARWLGGKGALAKADLGKTLAKVNTGAAVWGAGESGKDIQPGVTLARAFGAVAIAGGGLTADVHAVLATPAMAQTVVTVLQAQVDAAKQSTLPAPIPTVLGGVSVAATGEEVVVKVSATDKDATSLLGMALGGATP